MYIYIYINYSLFFIILYQFQMYVHIFVNKLFSSLFPYYLIDKFLKVHLKILKGTVIGFEE